MEGEWNCTCCTKRLNGQEKGYRRIGTREEYVPLNFGLWNHIRRTKGEKGHGVWASLLLDYQDIESSLLNMFS